MTKEFEASMKTSDPFATIIGDFIDSSLVILDDLKIQREEMDTRFFECVEFYGEDKKATPDSFLGTFKTFFVNFEKARKDNENEAEAKAKAEERIRKQEAKDQKIIDDLEAAKKSEEDAEGILGTERKGVMDDLISQVKTGNAFKSKTRTRRAAPKIDLTK